MFAFITELLKEAQTGCPLQNHLWSLFQTSIVSTVVWKASDWKDTESRSIKNYWYTQHNLNDSLENYAEWKKPMWKVSHCVSPFTEHSWSDTVTETGADYGCRGDGGGGRGSQRAAEGTLVVMESVSYCTNVSILPVIFTIVVHKATTRGNRGEGTCDFFVLFFTNADEAIITSKSKV